MGRAAAAAQRLPEVRAAEPEALARDSVDEA